MRERTGLRRVRLFDKIRQKSGEGAAYAVAGNGIQATIDGRFLPFVHLSMLVWLIAGIACLCLIYGILLPLLGCITRDDLHRSVSH